MTTAVPDWFDLDRFVAVTRRARAAFALKLGDFALEVLQHEAPRHEFALKARARMAAWIGGDPVNGGEIWYFASNYDDTGMVTFAKSDEPRTEDDAWDVMTTVVGYVAWHAYKAAREIAPEGVEDADDSVIVFILERAAELRSWRDQQVAALYNFLLDHYKTENTEDAGPAIRFEDLLA